MKKISFLFFLALFSMKLFGQISFDGFTTMYAGLPSDTRPIIMTMVPVSNPTHYAQGNSAKIPAHLEEGRKDGFSVVQIFDSSSSYFLIRNLSAAQAHNYEVRILENNTTLLPWTRLDKAALSTASDKDVPLAYVGAYKAARGNYLLADLRRTGSDSILSSAIVFFQEVRPRLTHIYFASELNKLMKLLSDPLEWEKDTAEWNKWKGQYQASELDTATGLPKKLRLSPEQNSVIFYLGTQIQKTKELEYQLVKDGKVYREWGKNEFDNGFIWLSNLPPGEYELQMRFAIQPGNVSSYPFRIAARWDQTSLFKFFLGGSIAAFFGFILMLFRARGQRGKLLASKARQQKAEAEMKAVYAQLNPHFVFNALSSIQGLVNTGETEKANHYLSTFSKLLRDSLVNGEKKTVSLESELNLLDTYLRLEQLRFSFTYTITTSAYLDTRSIEMPPLLLQPLVENAVKHGVAHKYGQGKIDISVKEDHADLIIIIADNGEGFIEKEAASGFGLRLTRQRLALLNETSDQKVEMKISPEKSGTSIVLKFINRLA